MSINISDPTLQTLLFSLIFMPIALLWISKDPLTTLTTSRSNELKGFAILGVIFAHIGYFLASSDKFLFPYSIFAGIAVNLFLVLSGYGITASALSGHRSIINFYQKRLLKLLIPMWTVLSLLILADFFILHRSYPLSLTLQNYIGFFPKADLWQQIDSPLWYFSLILLFYLLFPLLYWRKFPLLAPISLILVSTVIVRQKLPVDPSTQDLYHIHYLAWPLGSLLAVLLNWHISNHLKKIFRQTHHLLFHLPLRLFMLLIFSWIFIDTAINSGVDTTLFQEHFVSLISTFSIILIALVKPVRFRLFSLFGRYSYEIYLIHWPIMARYDLYYRYLPAWLATIFYLATFIALGYFLQKFTNLVNSRLIQLKHRLSL